MDRTDKQLVGDYLSGNENAFRVIVERYLKPIYGYAFRLTGSKRDADDIVQDVFVKVWKNIGKYDLSMDFKTWLFVIARNTIFDYLKKRKEYVFSDFENEEGENELAENLADESDLPDELVLRSENAEIIKKMITELPKKFQEILSLRYEDDLSFMEISKILEKPLNTVRSYHRRALLKLKEKLTAAPK